MTPNQPKQQNPVFTVSPIRESPIGVNHHPTGMSFTQRDIGEDHSSLLLMSGGQHNQQQQHQFEYNQLASATAGFNKYENAVHQIDDEDNDEYDRKDEYSPMARFMEQTIKHRQDRLRE